MEFDWAFYEENWEVSKKQIEEVFEDPFNLRLMPDSQRFSGQSRFFCLGQDTAGNYLMVVYTTNGKIMRIISARKMTLEESTFYAQKMHRNL